MTSKGGKGHPARPMAAPNRGIGKELPRDVAPGDPLPDEGGNRRQRRAREAWLRKQKRGGQS